MTLKNLWICCALCAASFAFHAGQAFARPNSSESGHSSRTENAGTPRGNPAAGQTSAAEPRDGQHDFDPLIGSWKYHLKRRLNPLTGSNTWVELEGTGTCIKVWDGRANMDQFEGDGPSGHIEGLTLRLYNPQSHQWSLYWANSKDGNLGSDPPQIGEFKNGRGEFYAQVMRNGRGIFVRYDWSGLNTNSPHFEQAFSDDGGRTWEVNWITDQTRVSDGAENTPAPENSEPTKTASQEAQHDGQHDFDFEVGAWKQHLKRLVNPLTGSHTWVEFDGMITGQKIWNGRANLDEFEGEGPTGHIEGLTLRLYNPQTRQWSLYWANSKVGFIDGPPQVGEFKNGRGEFYAQDTFKGRAILIRYVWSDITANSAHFEQSFSDDGGQTWEVNWISSMTRAN